MIIPVKKKDLFENYLKWLDPVLNLKDTERKILSSFMGFHYVYRHYDPDKLNELLFSPETQEMISKKHKIKKHHFQKAMKTLEEKNILIDKSINPHLTNYPKDGNFKLVIQFKLED